MKFFEQKTRTIIELVPNQLSNSMPDDIISEVAKLVIKDQWIAQTFSLDELSNMGFIINDEKTKAEIIYLFKGQEWYMIAELEQKDNQYFIRSVLFSSDKETNNNDENEDKTSGGNTSTTDDKDSNQSNQEDNTNNNIVGDETIENDANDSTVSVSTVKQSPTPVNENSFQYQQNKQSLGSKAGKVGLAVFLLMEQYKEVLKNKLPLKILSESDFSHGDHSYPLIFQAGSRFEAHISPTISPKTFNNEFCARLYTAIGVNDEHTVQTIMNLDKQDNVEERITNLIQEQLENQKNKNHLKEIFYPFKPMNWINELIFTNKSNIQTTLKSLF